MSTNNCIHNLVEDEAMGHRVCTKCGQIMEENIIVSEVSFSEKSNGAAVADGFFISSEKARASIPNRFGGRNSMNTLESREQVIANGRRRIQQIANALNMTERHMEAAQRYYNLAVLNDFNKGRKTVNVASACLYIVCRMEKTSHLLIDFSDVLQTNVYLLGATFLKLVQKLHLELPLVDPALYIARFASKLDFGDKSQVVIRDALRLVSRMNRDWIQTGRRPAGICAACLLIAARMHDFHRTQKEIISVVKICNSTLRKRLDEFRNTPSSELTIEDFQNIWLEETCDPPSFKNARKKGKRKRSIEPEYEKDYEDEELKKEINDILKGDEIKELTGKIDMDELLADDNNLEVLDNDEEIKDVILNEEEVEFKTRVWTNENKDWIEAQEAKRRQAIMDLENGVVRKPRTKKRNTNKDPAPTAQTPAEAAKKLLTQTKISKKINYAAIDHLFEDSFKLKNEN